MAAKGIYGIYVKKESWNRFRTEVNKINDGRKAARQKKYSYGDIVGELVDQWYMERQNGAGGD